MCGTGNAAGWDPMARQQSVVAPEPFRWCHCVVPRSMEKPMQPLYDDEQREVSGEKYWAQKELGRTLGITAVHVGDLLRSVGLLMPDARDATPEAADSEAAKHVTAKTAGGFHRYPRWNKDLVLEPLARALEGMPKPLPRNRPPSHAAHGPHHLQSVIGRTHRLVGEPTGSRGTCPLGRRRQCPKFAADVAAP